MLIGPKVAPRLAHMSILKPCRALMTDLGGFTGWYLKPELEGTGYEVSCPMDNRDRAIDLLDAEGLAQAVAAARSDMVVHLAGISFVARADVDAIYRVNIVGTRNLLAALAGG